MATVPPVDTAPGARRRLRLSSPTTGETLYELEVQNGDDVAQAVERARKAQPGWSALSFHERGRYALRALETLVEKQDDFIEVIVRESGKPRGDALGCDIFPACDCLSYYAKHTARLLRPEKKRLRGLLRLTKQLRIVYRPRGVVAVISPWTGPFILALKPTLQALMAGNAVIVKPSEVAPLSGKLVADLFQAAGLPDDVLTVVIGDGATGAELVEAGVDAISFSGSVAAGRRVAEECARRLIPCRIELGGKAPMIVCEDADLDRAAGGAIAGAFTNAGQVRCGTERVYVVDEVSEAFTDKVVARASLLRQGDHGEFDVGALFGERQLETIEDHVRDALEKGAELLMGGRRNPDFGGFFFEPTILANVTHDMKVMREETLGPILPIMRVRDEEEAIARANDARCGFSANVWTRDRRKGLEIAQRINAGGVCVNDSGVTYGIAEAPFGGLEESGIGQADGKAGLRGYCRAVPVVVDRFGGRRSAGTYPHSFRKDARRQKLARFLYGTPLGRRLS